MASEKLPTAQHALDGNNAIPSIPWYSWFSYIDELASAGSITADEAAQAIYLICIALGSPDGTPENIPPLTSGLPVTTFVVGSLGIQVDGSLAGGGVTISLDASLGDLNDVNTTGAANGDALVFNGADWVPGQISQVFQRMDTDGDFRITADGNLRVTN